MPPLKPRNGGACPHIKRLLLSGHNPRQVSAALSVDLFWVYHYARREGLPLNRPFTKRLTTAILRSLRAGFSPADLAPLYRQTPARIAALAQQHLFLTPKSGGASPSAKPSSS